MDPNIRETPAPNIRNCGTMVCARKLGKVKRVGSPETSEKMVGASPVSDQVPVMEPYSLHRNVTCGHADQNRVLHDEVLRGPECLANKLPFPDILS